MLINPLFYQLVKNDVKLFDHFLSKGYSLFDRNAVGLSLIDSLATGAIVSKDFIEFLIAKNIPFSSAVLHSFISTHQFDLIQSIVNSQDISTLDEVNKNGQTLLQNFLAIFYEIEAADENEEFGFQTLKYLVEKGINLNKQNEKGETILHYFLDKAVDLPDFIKQKWINYLVSEGADPSIRNKLGLNAENYFRAKKSHLVIKKT